MAPTLTLTPDIFNNPTQIKTKCITRNKTELLKPFLLPLPMCVLCDLFMLFFVDSCISGCSGFQPFTSLSPIPPPSSCWSPSSPRISFLLSCRHCVWPELNPYTMSTGVGEVIYWNTGNLSVLHYSESDTLPAAAASCQSHLREGWELMSPSPFQDGMLTVAVQCVSWVGVLCFTGTPDWNYCPAAVPPASDSQNLSMPSWPLGTCTMHSLKFT